MAKLIEAMILILMLAVAHHAEADCAWVLWQQSADIASPGPESEPKLVPLKAVDSRQECEQEVAKQLAAGTQLGGKPLDTGIVIFGLAMNYRCLPDTIDPRGPKGTGR